MAFKKNPLTLHITSPDGTTVESRSESSSVIVGSGSDAAIKIADPQVSNHHVELRVEADGVKAIDLGSENGTRIGNRVITDPTPLSSGDTLSIGNSQVKVLFAEGQGYESVVMMTPKSSVGRSATPARAPRTDVALTGKDAAMVLDEAFGSSSGSTPTETDHAVQVSLAWGNTLIDVKQFGDGVPVQVGDGPGNHFNVFGSGVGQSFELARGTGTKIRAAIPAGAQATIFTQGNPKGRKATGGAGPIELGLHDRAHIAVDNVAFELRFVRPSKHVVAATMEEADFTFFKVASFCILLFLALVAAVILTPRSDFGTADDIFQNPSKYVKLLVKPEKKVELKMKELSGAAEGAKAKDKEGKFGKQEAKKQDADPSKKGSPVVDANKREEDRKAVMKAGLLGVLGTVGAASNVFGPGGLGTGINDALGGLKGGAGMGDAHGVGGLGARGTGPGGGGTGLGLGGLGTKGTGRGAGGSGLDLGGRGKESTRVIPGKTTVIGGLDKDVIAKIIKRHQNEIKYCYEQELNKTPSLSGKVAVSWVIDPTGAVTDANVTESSLANSTAESCMLTKIRRWKFPEPQGGGIVNVSFPWLFKPAGSEGDE